MADANTQLVTLFNRMADVLDILGANHFRVNAFRKAARAVDNLTEDISQITTNPKALTAIDDIGQGAAQRITEFVKTGQMADYDELMDKIPVGLIKLLEISGLGPKTIALLWKEAGIENIDDLKVKLQNDALGDLPGLGKKKLDNLRKSIAFTESSGQRVLLGQALPMALWFVGELGKLQQVQQATYAGSLRRGCETIGDIDIIVAADPQHASAISESFVKLDPVTDVLVQGATKSSVRTSQGMQVDLRIVAPQQYGAALMYFTGSREHNIAMRQRAIGMDLRLNEYGLFQNDQPIAGKTEEEVFKALGLEWIAPQLREDHGELALVQQGRLPVLVTLDDIRADLHAHTNASDGRWSIHELAAEAVERGYHTVAITDHSKGQAQAGGLSNARLEEHIKEVHRAAERMKDQITILAGSEVDILADGQLDYPNSLLKQLDIVIASPHAALSQEPHKATARLLKAIANPYVTILGHPTGRLLLRRAGLHPDMPKLIAAAAGRNIALEINASTWRLDLRDTHARAAVEAGVKLAINTDAHGPGDMDQMLYGVLTARRAGATKEHIINCMARDQLSTWLKSTRP